MNYGDSVATGKYVYDNGGEHSALILNPDHTFEQTLRMGNVERTSEGSWRRVGEGSISFSKEFLVISGDEPEPDGTTFSDMHKALGLFVSLRIRQYHVLWYGKTDSGSSVTGTYKGDEPEISATLTLNPDHSFEQTVSRSGVANHATGTWGQNSDGTVLFSKDFLKTSGRSLDEDENASSMDPQGSNLQVEISKAKHTVEPVFHKRPAFR